MSSKKDIKESYDSLGGRIYDIRYLEEQGKKYDVVLDRIIPDDDYLVLDNGCGTGLLFEKIKAPTVGIDLSINLLRKARDRIHNCRRFLVNADSEFLPFRDAVFNFVYSFTVLQNLCNQSEGVREVWRVSKQDSQIAITSLRKAYSEEKFTSLLTDAGFNVLLFDDDELADFVAFLRKSPF